MHAVNERWQQLAIELGDRIYQTMNTAKMVGTKDETGYCLMFFNAANHRGRSTLVSSTTDRAELKRLLQFAIDNLDGPKTKIVPPGTRQ